MSTKKLGPARPRNAASLVIFRKYRNQYQVLMGRRGSKAKFKPGVYVFPGGIVERDDYVVQPKKKLKTQYTRKMAVANSHRKANGLAMCAVREAFEEVGLTLGEKGQLNAVRNNTWQHFKQLGLSPNLKLLDYLGRAITPPVQPIRFHARFFSINFEQMHGNILGDGELEDIRWVRLDQSEKLEMMLVQKMIMETLAKRLSGLSAPAQKLFFSWGRINIKRS